MVKNNKYYTKPFTGGAANFSGINYQTKVALLCMFESALGNKFKGISLESFNDFIIHENDGSTSVQVKKTRISFNTVKGILLNIDSTAYKKALIVATSFDKKTKELFKVIEDYKETIKLSELNVEDSAVKCIVLRYKDFLNNNDLDSLESILLETQIIEIPNGQVDDKLYIQALEFGKLKQKVIDVPPLIDRLKSIFMEFSQERKSFVLNELKNLMENYTYIEYGSGLLSLKSTLYKDSDQLIVDKYKEKYNEAERLIANNEYEKGFEIFNSLNQIFETDNLIIKCAVCLNSLGKYKESIQYVERILNQQSENIEALFIKANNLAEMNHFDEALLVFNQILEVNPNIPECYYNIGYIYHQQDNNQLAIEYYKKCLEIDKSFVSAHVNISHLYFVQGNMDTAKDHCNKAISIDKKCYQAYSRIGEIYRYLGDFKNAISYFIRCLKLDQSNYESLLGIAISYIYERNRLSAKTYFEIFLSQYLNKFLKEGEEYPKRVLLTDLGEDYRNFILLTIIDANNAILNINDIEEFKINLNVKSDNFGVGILGIENDESSYIPVLSFSYENKAHFKHLVSELVKLAKDDYSNIEYPNFLNKNLNLIIIDSEPEIYLEIKESIEAISMTLNIPTKDGEIMMQLHGSLFHVGDGYRTFKEYISQSQLIALKISSKNNEMIFLIKDLKLR